MYQWDAPKAERSIQQLGLDRNQLAALMRNPDFAGTLKPEAVNEVAGQAAHTAPGRRARSATELAQLLEELGDLTLEEIEARADGDAVKWLDRLAEEGRTEEVALSSGKKWVVTSQSDEYRAIASIGAEPGPSDREALRNVLRRFMARSGTVTETDIAERYGVANQLLNEELEAMSADDELAWGYFTVDAGEREWAVRQNIERIQARTLSILRSEIRPASPLRYQAEAMYLQRLTPDRHVSGSDGLKTVLTEMRGVALAPAEWTSRVLPARVTGFTISLLDQLLKSGEVIPVTTSQEDSPRPLVTFIPRGEGHLYLRNDVLVRAIEPVGRSAGDFADVMDFIAGQGITTSGDLRSAFADLRISQLKTALSSLVRSGRVTTDSWVALSSSLQEETGSDQAWPMQSDALVHSRTSPRSARGRTTARRQAGRRMRELTSGLPEDANWFPVSRFSRPRS